MKCILKLNNMYISSDEMAGFGMPCVTEDVKDAFVFDKNDVDKFLQCTCMRTLIEIINI